MDGEINFFNDWRGIFPAGEMGKRLGRIVQSSCVAEPLVSNPAPPLSVNTRSEKIIRTVS